jgi:Arc/MetJ-type ribon-helix-helix transcriptional regulator
MPKKERPHAKQNISIPAELMDWVKKRVELLNSRDDGSIANVSSVIATAVRQMMQREADHKKTR